MVIKSLSFYLATEKSVVITNQAYIRVAAYVFALGAVSLSSEITHAAIAVNPNNNGSTDVVEDPDGAAIALVNPLTDPLTVNADIAVGNSAMGELQINAGSDVIVTGSGVIGNDLGSMGKVSVTGAGSTWEISGNLTVGAQGQGQLDINNNAVVTVNGLVAIGDGSGEGTLIIDGGTLDNSGGNGIIVQNGTLRARGEIAGSIINQDVVEPGTSVGILNLTGAYVQDITGLLRVEIYGMVTGQFDEVNISSTASLSGDLELNMIGLTPAPSDTFSILTAGTLVGEFGNVADGARLNITEGGTGSFQVDYNATSVILSDFQGTVDVLPGDFNVDDIVDGFDFLLWQRGGSPNPFSATDLSLWEANFGFVPATAASVTAVPEPSGVSLFLLGLGVLGALRQRV